MRAALLLIVSLTFVQDAPPKARTRTVVASEKRIEIVLPVSEANKSITAVIRFPEDGLDSIVVSWNESDLSLERRKGNLFLKLLRAAEGDIHVLGATGRLYRLYLRPAKHDEDYDARIEIRLPSSKHAKRTPAIDLIRSMRLGQIPPDATVRASEVPLLKSAEMEMTLRFVYDSAHYRGYVLALKNLSDREYRLDPSRFSSDGLILIGSRRILLPPQESTTLYLVYWK